MLDTSTACSHNQSNKTETQLMQANNMTIYFLKQASNEELVNAKRIAEKYTPKLAEKIKIEENYRASKGQ